LAALIGMSTLASIIVFGVLMSILSLIGGVSLFLSDSQLKRITLPLVAFASGSLIGGALFHMMPAAADRLGSGLEPYLWVAAGFLVFLLLEQVLHWHHCHKGCAEHRRPLGTMVLIADGLHNFIGGLSIGALFLADFRLGVAAWVAAAAHEIPQEIGDFGILIHSGWSRRQALLFNFLSGITFLVGMILAYGLSQGFNIDFLIPFAAGNFLYIGAVDLIPEFKESWRTKPEHIHTLFWILGLLLLLLARLFLG
jgi:zinc and cadmium transporter